LLPKPLALTSIRARPGLSFPISASPARVGLLVLRRPVEQHHLDSSPGTRAPLGSKDDHVQRGRVGGRGSRGGRSRVRGDCLSRGRRQDEGEEQNVHDCLLNLSRLSAGFTLSFLTVSSSVGVPPWLCGSRGQEHAIDGLVSREEELGIDERRRLLTPRLTLRELLRGRRSSLFAPGRPITPTHPEPGLLVAQHQRPVGRSVDEELGGEAVRVTHVEHQRTTLRRLGLARIREAKRLEDAGTPQQDENPTRHFGPQIGGRVRPPAAGTGPAAPPGADS